MSLADSDRRDRCLAECDRCVQTATPGSETASFCSAPVRHAFPLTSSSLPYIDKLVVVVLVLVLVLVLVMVLVMMVVGGCLCMSVCMQMHWLVCEHMHAGFRFQLGRCSCFMCAHALAFVFFVVFFLLHTVGCDGVPAMAAACV